MSKRINPFANVTSVPAFETKQKTPSPVAQEAIDTIAEAHNFPSRQARGEAKLRRRKPRLHRTGRSENFSIKASGETKDRFYRLADERQVTCARLLELALDALEGAGASV